MKRVIPLALVMIIVFALPACRGNTPPPNPSQSPESITEGDSVKFDTRDNTESIESGRPAVSARIRITAGETALYAVMHDNPTAQEFVELLPLTLDTFDRINLVKSTVLPQAISDEGERTREYAPGAIFYWPEGPEVAFCYSDHLPETVVDIIHIGMIESGVEFFRDYTGEILIELADESAMQTTSDTQSRNIKIMVDDIVVAVELDDSEIARQFVSLLPQTISMSRGRNREYYGRINGSLSYDEGDIQTTAEDGDLAYWFSGNSLAFFFNTENDSAVNSGIVVFGKITSDLSVFNDMGGSKTMTVALSE